MSVSNPLVSAQDRLADLKRRYWEMVQAELNSGRKTLGEVIRGFVLYLTSELGVNLVPVAGAVNHRYDDPVDGAGNTLGFLDQLDSGLSTAYVGGGSAAIRRYTAAHEIAHILNGDVGLQHRTRQRPEPLVEAIAAEILMPERFVRSEFIARFEAPIFATSADDRFLALHASVGRNALARDLSREITRDTSLLAARATGIGNGKRLEPLCELLAVSATAMARRLEDLGLVNPPPSSLTKANPAFASSPLLSSQSAQKLRAGISEFLRWLVPFFPGVEVVAHPIVFCDPSPDDWVMRKTPAGVVEFNTFILGRASFEFYELVVLHEAFHLFLQNVPNKSDVRRIRDSFDDLPVHLLDVQADYYSARYLKDRRQRSLGQILALYHQNHKVFTDTDIRVPKLERFIGSVISIVGMFEARGANSLTASARLYLPAIANVVTEGRIDLIIMRASLLRFESRMLPVGALIDIKSCYKEAAEYSPNRYIESLVRFARTALSSPPIN
jgi:Zn-dependent peptidase ImmA (M78 family)